jgi:peptide/nickel transport system substrate-binding protein
MQKLRWQVLIAALGMLLVVGLLAGQSRAVVVTSVPSEGGIYTEALVGSPRALNPLLAYANPVDRDISRLIFSGLIRFDAYGRPIPDLANWLVSEDQLTYTFVLKPDLTWHDGQPLTADDVAFTIELMQDTGYPGPADRRTLWQTVKVTVADLQTIQLTLPEPFAPFLDYTSFGILPRHLLGRVKAADLAKQEFNLRPVGSGPFMFDRWLASSGRVDGVVLIPFPNYRGARPRLTEVRFSFYADSAAALAAYQQGKVQGVAGLGLAQMPAALKLAELNIYSAVRPQYSLILLNMKSGELPFFQEKKVRQALLAGLNRKAMVLDVMQGQAVVANSPILPGSWAYNLALPTVEYNPSAAVGLLESAGWLLPEGATPGVEGYVRQKQGKPLSFTLLTPDDATHLALANMAASTWADLGVQAVVTPVDAALLRSQYLEPRAFQAVLVDLDLAGTPDPDPYPFWHETQAESGQNYSGFVDRAISQDLEQARITTDMSARARLYQSFQSRFADQTPALLLFYPVYNYGVDSKVGGVQIGPLTETSDRFATIADWYIVTRRVVVEPSGVPETTGTPAASTPAP